MNLFDIITLLAASGVSGYAIWVLVSWQNQVKTQDVSHLYHLVAFSVLLLSSLSLAIFGWDILGFMGDGAENKLVAVFASAIPFAWATGLVTKMYPKHEKQYLGLMLLGLVLITFTRFMEMKTLGRILYPVFHSTAGLTVIAVPILAVINQKMSKNFLWIALGGALISTGGISMAFLIAGRQLLFFSTDVVLSIMAPLLLITASLYIWGLIQGEK